MNNVPQWNLAYDDLPKDQCILVNPFDVKNLKLYNWEESGLGWYASLTTNFKRKAFAHWTGYEPEQGEVMSPQCFHITGEDSLGLCINPHHMKLVKYVTRKKHIQRDIKNRKKIDKMKKKKGDKLEGWDIDYVNPMSRVLIDEYRKSQKELCDCPCHQCHCKCPK